MATYFLSLLLLTLPVFGQSSCLTPFTVPNYSNDALPDPFLFFDGTRTATADDWTCRHDQISAIVQGYEAGDLPAKPTSLSATFTQQGTTGTLAITIGQNGKNVSFSQPITYPSGTAPANGWPLLIAYGGASFPVPSGVAVANYNNDNIGQQNDQSSRGVGVFYSLYGKNATASAMTAWVWGVSRIIDALEATSTAHVDTTKIAVTGCSRNGKGALMAGAFEPRIALTIPVESGSGGDASWRLSAYQIANNQSVQDATEIVQENVWFSTNFNNYVHNLSTLPYDHHSLAALVAPRGLISYENTDYLWLSPLSSWGAMSAAHTVYTALGVPDNHGFQQVGGHSHCAWPTSLNPSLSAFFDKFLLGKSGNTTYFSTNNVFGGVVWDPTRWMNWTVPQLS